MEEERSEREVGIGGEVNWGSWGCVGLGFGVEGGCCHGCLESEKMWELFVSRESRGLNFGDGRLIRKGES